MVPLAVENMVNLRGNPYHYTQSKIAWYRLGLYLLKSYSRNSIDYKILDYITIVYIDADYIAWDYIDGRRVNMQRAIERV